MSEYSYGMNVRESVQRWKIKVNIMDLLKEYLKKMCAVNKTCKK